MDIKFKGFFVARSDDTETAFNLMNPELGFDCIKGATSLFDTINDIIWNEDLDYCAIVHDDVYLSRNFKHSCVELVHTLNDQWYLWGVCGNAGVSLLKWGFDARNIVKYVSDKHSPPDTMNAILPCLSVDGNVLLLNTRALREKHLKLPTWGGFQLYDIVLSSEVIKSGLLVLASPKLLSVHNSGGNQSQFDLAKSTKSFKEFMSKSWRNSTIVSLNGPLDIGLGRRITGDSGRDIIEKAHENTLSSRQKRSVAILVRTQFRSKDLLKRCLFSIKSLASFAPDCINVNVTVLTDKEFSPSDWLDFEVNILKVDNTEGVDSRFILLLEASQKIEADFYWIIDDDDWAFPNAAQDIYFTLSSCPLNSIIFCDTQVFLENFPSNGEICSESYSCTPGHYRSASHWPQSFSGENHVPICGMILSKTAFSFTNVSSLKGIEYYEDYFILLNALKCSDQFTIVLDKLSVGISVRQSAPALLANTVTEKDRTKWNKSLINMYDTLINETKLNKMRCIHNGYTSNYSLKTSHVNLPPAVATSRVKRSKKTIQLFRGLLKLQKEENRKAAFIIMKSEGIKSARKFIRSLT